MSIAIELEGVLRPASHRETGEFYTECYSAVSGKGGECENGRLPPCLDVRADFAQIHPVSLLPIIYHLQGGGAGLGLMVTLVLTVTVRGGTCLLQGHGHTKKYSTTFNVLFQQSLWKVEQVKR